MLNIIKYKIKNINLSKNKNNLDISKYNTNKNKEYIPSVRHWKNSIYVYNKNTLSLIPEAEKITFKLINSYFKLYLKKLRLIITKFLVRGSLRKKVLSKLNKNFSSTNRIFITKGQLRHTNDFLNITIYFYNKEISNYLSILKRFFNNKKNKSIILKKLRLIKRIAEKNKIKQENIQKVLLLNTKNQDLFYSRLLKEFRINQKISYKKYIHKHLKIVILYIRLLQLIYLNKSKFNNIYLQGLVNLIKKIYKKNVIFNFVNLKYFYLNSDIFTEILGLKIRKKNRKHLKKDLKIILKKTKIQKKKDLTFDPNFKYKFNTENLNLVSSNNLDITNILLYNLLLKNKTKSSYLKKIIFDNVKYKKVSGIRLQTSGRLTRRYTASRSLSNIKYKGSLININSSEYKCSSTLLRGNFKPNLDFSKFKSKTRIGSFGIKGWISGI